MRRIASAGALPGAAVLLAGALLAGCSTPSNSGPAWTAEPSDSGATATASPDGSATAGPSSGATAAASGSATAGPAATASAWKTFSDPAKTVVFDLPESWIAQSVPPEEGTLPGALKIEVKKPDGTFVAALRTGLPPGSQRTPGGPTQ